MHKCDFLLLSHSGKEAEGRASGALLTPLLLLSPGLSGLLLASLSLFSFLRRSPPLSLSLPLHAFRLPFLLCHMPPPGPWLSAGRHRPGEAPGPADGGE